MSLVELTTEDAIDLQHLEQYTDGDNALLTEILTIFLGQVETCLQSLKIDADDQTWRDACHSLKGAARGVGAWKLGDAAAEAEAMTGNVDGIQDARPRHLETIKYQADIALAQIQQLCQ
ncbi:MAG: Hpt domain-containing protein [Pseudomonadota bacterium]